jgi:hypothetical protein
MPQKDACFHLIEDTKVLCKNGKSNHSNISKAQGSQLVSPLPPTPWALASRRDDEIHDVLERHAYYHPEICQILQILPRLVNKRHSQSMELSLHFGGSICPQVYVCIPTYVGCVTWSHM